MQLLTLLFWTFAAAWIALFVYLYGFMRRINFLEQDVANLCHHGHAGHGPVEAEERPALSRASPGETVSG